MSRHIRYTCAKKKHPVLKKDCEECEMYDPCAAEGKWCFVGALIAENEPAFLTSATGKTSVCAEASVLIDQSTVTIHLDSQTSVEMSEEDFAVQIKKALYSSMNSGFEREVW